jgi:DNA ligase (NAD+)
MKNGTLTPVAVFEPIEIDGATIQRATLNNARYIENLKIEIGDTLEIIRANLVIPRVVGNITKGTSII